MAQTSIADIPNYIKERLPRHVAIIMDGNGRWAKKRGMMRVFGHKNAVGAVRAAVSMSGRLGIEELTLFAFSSENWRRPQEEVGFLMDLLAKYLVSEVSELKKDNVRIKMIGDLSKFGDGLKDKIAAAESDTSMNTGLKLNIAVNYGGRWDIASACREIISSCQNIQDAAAAVTEESISERLSASDVDLMIRTGGEQRISNFLLWQMAYAELYFTDILWPDFSEDEYAKALAWFAGRERRFGCTGEQIKALLADS